MKRWPFFRQGVFFIFGTRHSALRLKLRKGNKLTPCSVTEEIPVGTNEILSTKLLKFSVTREISEKLFWKDNKVSLSPETNTYQITIPGYCTAHFPQQCHNSKFVIFQERLLKVLECYNFLWVQRRHNCSPAASFANCVMTLYLSKMHLQTFLSIPITQKCQILSCDNLVANERYNVLVQITPKFKP
jgi:hypothetical protein